MAIAFASEHKPATAPKRGKAPAPVPSKQKAKSNVDMTTNPMPVAAEIDVMKLPVFEPAGVFPMLAEDDLQELADDIKANGLREPLVIGEIEIGEGKDAKKVLMLIDGRNRREACRRAGVTPSVRVLGGQEATAFVLSVNVNRRHMNAGQRAAARAFFQPETRQGKRTDLDTSFATKEVDVSAPMLSKARLVLRYDRPLLVSVINGATSLDDAYAQAKRLQSEQEAKEVARLAERAKLDALRKRYPDLARRVEEDGLGLNSMLTEAADRDAAAKSQRQSLFLGLKNARAAMAGFAASEELPRLPGYLKAKETRKEFVDAAKAIAATKPEGYSAASRKPVGATRPRSGCSRGDRAVRLSEGARRPRRAA